MTGSVEAWSVDVLMAERCAGSANQPFSNVHRRDRSRFRLFAAAMLLVGLVTAGPAHSRSIESYQPLIAEAAYRFAIPMHWIHAVIVAESAADPLAVSDKGAIGLMQIMPETWGELRTRYGMGSDPFVPADNILAGSAYLREMLDRYGSVALMLAAYNAGPGRVDDHLASGRALPEETIAYIAELLPQLSATHPSFALQVPADWPTDPSAGALFPQAGDDFYAGQESASAHSWPFGATVQPQASVPPASQGAAINSPLFVQPNTRPLP